MDLPLTLIVGCMGLGEALSSNMGVANPNTIAVKP